MALIINACKVKQSDILLRLVARANLHRHGLAGYYSWGPLSATWVPFLPKRIANRLLGAAIIILLLTMFLMASAVLAVLAVMVT